MFTKFLDVLPDPNYGISRGGGPGTNFGQSFASVKLSQPDSSEDSRTISGRLINRSNKYTPWNITIEYNPMTKIEFEPVYNFLMEKRGGLKPFFISLPQYRRAKDPLFADNTINNNIMLHSGSPAGVSSIEIAEDAWQSSNDYTNTGLPQYGDLFNIGFYVGDVGGGPSLVNSLINPRHTKAYLVTHVETHNLYKVLPPQGYIRVHFSPRLQRPIESDSEIIFGNPLIKVTQRTDIQSYKLNTEGLYKFSINLEEAFY